LSHSSLQAVLNPMPFHLQILLNNHILRCWKYTTDTAIRLSRWALDPTTPPFYNLQLCNCNSVKQVFMQLCIRCWTILLYHFRSSHSDVMFCFQTRQGQATKHIVAPKCQTNDPHFLPQTCDGKAPSCRTKPGCVGSNVTSTTVVKSRINWCSISEFQSFACEG
jgi:hypothetical protein